MKTNIRYLAFLATLILLALYGAAPLFLPLPTAIDAPTEQFSSGRAMAHVAVISQKPHPAGSPEMQQTASYLVDQLRKSGLEPDIQETTAQNGIHLRNVTARIPGAYSSGAVLILSHSDSTAHGPGSGDNATGASVLLETARALKAGPPLKNDIIILFDDGEELGYLGGYAFASDAQQMKDVRLVIGLDTAAWGPVVLLQTTPGNAAFIRAYASAVPNPAAFGFFADADWTISRDSSEIQPFYERGLPGLAMEDPTGFSGKHSPEDTVSLIRPGSLQQMGSQLLALARQLGNADLSQTAASVDESYFALWGIGLVHYPAGWNQVFVWLGLVLFLAALVLQVRRKSFRLLPLLFASLLILGLTLAAGILGLAASKIFQILFPNPNPYTGSVLLPASLPAWLISIVIISGLYLVGRARILRQYGPSITAAAGLIPWALLAVVTIWAMPVGSYLFSLPFLFMAIIQFWQHALEKPVHPVARWFPAALAAILFAPNIVLAYLGTGLDTLVLVAIFIVISLGNWAQQKE